MPADNGIRAIEARMKLLLQRAVEEATKAGFDLKITGKREDRGYAQELRDIAKQGSNQAASHLVVLASDIADTLDTHIAADRTKIKNAVSVARGILQESSKEVTAFDAWKALRDRAGDPGFQTIPPVLRDAKDRLADAIAWDKRQSEERRKLRLKALASQGPSLART